MEEGGGSVTEVGSGEGVRVGRYAHDREKEKMENENGTNIPPISQIKTAQSVREDLGGSHQGQSWIIIVDD